MLWDLPGFIRIERNLVSDKNGYWGEFLRKLASGAVFLAIDCHFITSNKRMMLPLNTVLKKEAITHCISYTYFRKLGISMRFYDKPVWHQLEILWYWISFGTQARIRARCKSKGVSFVPCLVSLVKIRGTYNLIFRRTCVSAFCPISRTKIFLKTRTGANTRRKLVFYWLLVITAPYCLQCTLDAVYP